MQDITNADFVARNIVNNATLELRCGEFRLAFSGVISGTGSVNVAGSNNRDAGGASGNTYSGATTISGGTLILAKTSGYAIPGDFTIANGNTYVVVQGANQFPATAKVTFAAARLSASRGVRQHRDRRRHFRRRRCIENTEGETGVSNGDADRRQRRELLVQRLHPRHHRRQRHARPGQERNRHVDPHGQYAANTPAD